MSENLKNDLSYYKFEIAKANDLSRLVKENEAVLQEQIKLLEQQKQQQKDKLEQIIAKQAQDASESLAKVNNLLQIEKKHNLAIINELEEYKYQSYLSVRSGLVNKIKYSFQRFCKSLTSGKKLSFTFCNEDKLIGKPVLLTEEPIWLELDVSNFAQLDFYLATKYDNVIQPRNKALLLIQYLSADNEVLKDVYGKIPYSSEKDANFYYLKDSDGKSVKVLSAIIPNQATKIRLGVCSFYNFINEYVYVLPQIFCQQHLNVKEISAEHNFTDVGVMPIGNQTVIANIQVKANESISLYGLVDYTNIKLKNDKQALLLISYFDSANKRLEKVYGKMPFSDIKQANFYYLADSKGKVVELATLKIPANAKSLQVGISGFGLQESETINFSQEIFISRAQPLITPVIASVVTPSKNITKSNHPQPIQKIKVAIILDEFSYNSFKDTFTPIIIEPSNWREVFERERPEIFFCESAWSGVDPTVRPWKGQIYASVNFKKENRTQLLAIIEYCNQNGIPTVFWNKEDPTHFTDRVHDFVKTAQLFDYVFTTAQECVESYKTEYGIKNVYCLQFATNPQLFNPIEKYRRSDDVIFAGSWYENHVERSEDMVKIFDAIVKSDVGLVIHDRYYGDPDPLHKYPERYLSYVKPNVPFKEIDKVYKGSIFGLNINTVKQSTTMFARRVFELMSSNTCVISNYSKGIKNMFGDSVIFLDENTSLLQNISRQQIEQIRENNLHNVLANHTYRNRFKTILDKIGFKYINDDANLTICCIINHREDAEVAVKFYYNQLLHNSKLLLIISEQVEDIEVAPLYTKFNGGNVEVISLSYIRKYGKLDYKISTSHCAFVNYHQSLDAHRLENAMLHTSYLNDEIILLSSGKKYHLSETEVLTDVIVKSQYFEYILQNYSQTVTNSFYSLNLGQN